MQRDARIPLWFLIANCVLILAALTLGIWIGQRRVHLLPEPQATALQLIHEAILSSHVDPHDPAELVDRAITGMVSGLDDYSQYVPPAKVQVFDEDMTGSYEGIGAVILATADAVVVRWPFPDGPAEQAGLQVGDRIVGIDGTSWATLAPEQRLDPSNKLLRGPKGSKVQLEVVRGEQAPFLVAVQRAPVQKASVKWIQLLDRDHGLGYLHIADFHSRTGH